MKLILRIKGQVGLNKDINETMYRLRLRKKYVAIIFNKDTDEQKGMIKKVRDLVAYGEVGDEILEKLISKRGIAIDKTKKISDVKKIVEGIKQGKSLEDFNLKPYFRLHPPIGGFKSKGKVSPTKTHYPKGVLGDHGNELNLLIERMI